MKVLNSKQAMKVTGGTNTEAMLYWTTQLAAHGGTLVQGLGSWLGVSGEKAARKFDAKGIREIAPDQVN